MSEPKKKRAKPVTMTSRSRSLLESQGWIVGLVERTVWIPKRVNGIPTGEKFMQKFDLWGWADLACVHPDKIGTLYVQTTHSTDAWQRRLKILEATAATEAVLKSQNTIQVHGWAKTGARGKRKLWTVKVSECHLVNGQLKFVDVSEKSLDEANEPVETLF